MARVLCESCGTQNELEALPQFEDEFEAENEFEDEQEYEFEDEAGLEGEGWLGAIGNIASSLLGGQELEDEAEDEFEAEDEAEDELSPIRKIYPDAMMEHLGELAAEAETEEEAVEHFLPLIGMAASKLLPVAARALAPMAKKALPKIARAVTRLTPQLTRGVGKIARTLHRQPGARPLLRAVPSIARRTVHSIARQVSHGRRVTPRSAALTLARQTRRVLGNPRQRRTALRHHHRMERQLHRRFGNRMVRPHWRWRWINGRKVRVPYRPAHVAGAPGAQPGIAAGATAAAPGRVGVAPAALGGLGVARQGRMVSGQCVCSPCPTCGGSSSAGSVLAAASAAPSYCRCCGQILR